MVRAALKGLTTSTPLTTVHAAVRWLVVAAVFPSGGCAVFEPSANREVYRLDTVWGRPVPAIAHQSLAARGGGVVVAVEAWILEGELVLYPRGTFRWTFHREVRYEDEPEPIQRTQQFTGFYQRTDSTITLIYREPSWGPRAPELVVTNNGRTLSGVQGVAEARAAYEWVLKE